MDLMNDQFDSKVKNRCGRKRVLLQDVGINDAEYPVIQVINGKQVHCPFHTRWSDMLKRCYSSQCQVRQPTYKGCYVHKDWLTFSTFKSWMEKQHWEGKHLDKDILIRGNKIYSQDTCVFVTHEVNSFLLDGSKLRGLLPIGVSISRGRYQASCSNKGAKVHLGYYETPELAHAAWYSYKAKLAKQLASEQTDPRVAEALLRRFPETTYE